jgi:hypothetical protein
MSEEQTRTRRTPLEKVRANPKSLRLSVNAKCYECMGGGSDPGVVDRIAQCDTEGCPLHGVRPYQGKPPRKRRSRKTGADRRFVFSSGCHYEFGHCQDKDETGEQVKSANGPPSDRPHWNEWHNGWLPYSEYRLNYTTIEAVEEKLEYFRSLVPAKSATADEIEEIEDAIAKLEALREEYQREIASEEKLPGSTEDDAKELTESVVHISEEAEDDELLEF